MCKTDRQRDRQSDSLTTGAKAVVVLSLLSEQEVCMRVSVSLVG